MPTTLSLLSPLNGADILSEPAREVRLNPAQFQPYLGSNQHMHRKRIIVRSYITLLKMINDTSFTSTPLLRGCELLCTRGLQYIAAYHSLVY